MVRTFGTTIVILGAAALTKAPAARAQQAPAEVVRARPLKPAASVDVDGARLRADASVYTTPAYPSASIAAKHTGRVVVAVVVAPNTTTSPLARVQSARVVEAPDTLMANAVLSALKDARYMPFYDDSDAVVKGSGEVVWDFRLGEGRAQVVDPYQPGRQDLSPRELAALDLRIADRASGLLDSPARWNRADDRQCPPRAQAVSLYCALELSTLQVAGSFDHRGLVMDDARAAMDDVTPHHPDYQHWLMDYNNDSTTTFADIQRILRVTHDHIARRLATP